MDPRLIEKVIEFAERSDPLSIMLSWDDETSLLPFMDGINPDFQTTMNEYDARWPEPGEVNCAYFSAAHLAFFLGAISALRLAGYERNQLKAISEMWIRAVSNETSGIFEPLHPFSHQTPSPNRTISDEESARADIEKE